MLMQIYADVTGCTMQISASSQTCALGAALASSVLAGVHGDFASAQAAMTSVKEVEYAPMAENSAVYDKLYRLYRQMHDSFGGLSDCADLTGLMKDLIAIKEAQNR